MTRRILFLRPFRSTPDNQIVAALAKAVAKTGRLVLVGPKADRLALESHWEKFGPDPIEMASLVEYVECASSEWKQAIHREIHAAHCVLLYLAPKSGDFPLGERLESELPLFEKYYDTPFENLSTGAGLLYEVAYLDRLGKIAKTVVVCRERESEYVRRLINRSSIDATFYRHMPDGYRAISVRRLAPDRQLARLGFAAGIVTFADELLSARRSQFSRALKRAVKSALGHQDASSPLSAHSWQVLLGISSAPRPLPPDGQLKIINYTNVENLLHIPRGEISEVSMEKARSRLTRRAIREGCPTCGAEVTRLFFYVNGLNVHQSDIIRVKCQNCMAYLQIEGRVLIEV